MDPKLYDESSNSCLSAALADMKKKQSAKRSRHIFFTLTELRVGYPAYRLRRYRFRTKDTAKWPRPAVDSSDSQKHRHSFLAVTEQRSNYRKKITDFSPNLKTKNPMINCKAMGQ